MRPRPGVLRVHRRPRLRRRDRGALQGGPPRHRAADVLEDLRARRAARRVRRRRRRTSSRRRARCGARSTSPRRRRRPRSRASATRRSSRGAAQLNAARARAARRGPPRATGSSRPGPPLGNFLFAEVGGRPGGLRAAPAAGRDRPPAATASARPRRSASRSARRRRTSSSRPRSDTSFRASRNAADNPVTLRQQCVSALPRRSWRRSAAAGVPPPLPVDARFEHRHAARGDRAGDRRQGPDELRPLGRRRAHRRVPADDRRRPPPRARSSTGSTGAR